MTRVMVPIEIELPRPHDPKRPLAELLNRALAEGPKLTDAYCMWCKGYHRSDETFAAFGHEETCPAVVLWRFLGGPMVKHSLTVEPSGDSGELPITDHWSDLRVDAAVERDQERRYFERLRKEIP